MTEQELQAIERHLKTASPLGFVQMESADILALIAEVRRLQAPAPWTNVRDAIPDEGRLCVLYFPMGVRYAINARERDRTFGPSAMAYYSKADGWVYADERRPVQIDPILLAAVNWRYFDVDDGAPPAKA